MPEGRCVGAKGQPVGASSDRSRGARRVGRRAGPKTGRKPVAAKVRADQLLVAQGLAESRTRAQALILAGNVFIGDKRVAKAGDMLAEDAALTVKGRDHPWVSRGGIKLDHGLDHFGFDVTGAVALDVGSSTGGFTDVLLTPRRGQGLCGRCRHQPAGLEAAHDPRVIVHEQTNARELTAEIIPEPVDIVVCDASFIGLAKVLDAALDLARPGAKLVALVKPQFEAGREEVGKGGVVRDPAVHQRVCDEAAAWVRSKGWTVCGIEQSPITGPEGNVEFLLGAIKAASGDEAAGILCDGAIGSFQMQSQNRMFDDLVKMMNGVAGTMAGMGREAEASMRDKMREWVGGMDFVARDEFEAVKAMAVAARDENEALKTRIAALEARRRSRAAAKPKAAPRRQSRERSPDRRSRKRRARRRRADRGARTIFRGARLGLRAGRRWRDHRLGDRQLGAI